MELILHRQPTHCKNGVDDTGNCFFLSVKKEALAPELGVISKKRVYPKKPKKRKLTGISGSPFFDSLFFPGETRFRTETCILSDEFIYEEKSLDDEEASLSIDYLSLNDESVVKERQCHIERLRKLFPDVEQLKANLKEHPEEAKFPTAIEAAFGISL
ncbi:MAG: hypothetical protein JXR76_02145 [Deltaproteobacteria bacterium]|nr:hypothetical protein [Deltaproteobacteria bacterium]